jgi:hypothetical protein
MMKSLAFFVSLACTQLQAQELWTFLDNGAVRVGINLSAGACVGWFSHSHSTENVLNAYDGGRYLQQSFYGDADASHWAEKPWRYNPVQGGSWQGQPSTVLEHKADKTSFYSLTTPRHWATGELLSEVRMEQWLRLDGGLARLHFKMTYTGKAEHKPTHQELPALFVQPMYSTLAYCEAGNTPWTNAGLKRRQPGFPNESAQFSEPWVAWERRDGQAVGLLCPHAKEATCYRVTGTGVGDCSYIAPVQTFALKPGLVFEYDVVLALGTVEQIRAIFEKVKP